MKSRFALIAGIGAVLLGGCGAQENSAPSSDAATSSEVAAPAEVEAGAARIRIRARRI